MDVGIVVPQGWTGEYRAMDPAAAWARSVAIARQADALGFESLWLFDHLHAGCREIERPGGVVRKRLDRPLRSRGHFRLKVAHAVLRRECFRSAGERSGCDRHE